MNNYSFLDINFNARHKGNIAVKIRINKKTKNANRTIKIEFRNLRGKPEIINNH